MIGWWKSFSAMPMWKRFLVASPVIFGTAWIALSLQAWLWVVVLSETIGAGMESEIEYDDTFFDLRGGFGADDVRVTKYLPDGNVGGTYRVDRVTITTPGLVWLLRNTYFKTSEVAPDHFGVVLDNPRNIADDANTPGNYTNLPYDAMGCTADTATLLTRGQLEAMGIDPKRHVTIALERDTDVASTLRYAMRTEGAGALEMRMQVGLDRPADLETLLVEMEEAPLQSVSMTFTDLGFVAARREACARKHRQTPAAFDDFHMQTVAQRLQNERLAFTPGVLDHYRDFATTGGTLEVRTTGPRKLTLMQFLSMNRVEQMKAFPAQVSVNGKPPAYFGVTWNAQPTAAVATANAAPAPLVATAALAPAAAPADPANPATGLPAPGSPVPYASLAQFTGQHIDVTTKYGSVRKGVLALVGPLAINLQLDKEEGGLLLTMPSDSITAIHYTPATPAAPPTAALDKAGTHAQEN